MKMKESEIIKNLDALAKLRSEIKSCQQDINELEDQAFLTCPDLSIRRHQLLQGIKVLSEKNAELAKVVTEAVLDKSESVKGEKLQAIFSKGRTTWNTTKLAGFAIAHPEINELKKVGKSSVSIREVKDKEKS